MATEEPEIVGITESWIHTDSRDYEGEYSIPEYKVFKKDRTSKEGGGVILYVKDYLDPVECKIETDHEMVGVDLNKLEKKVRVILLYRPPKQTSQTDADLYNNLSSLIKNKLCIITGDFNYRKINWKERTSDYKGKRLLDFISDEYLT